MLKNGAQDYQVKIGAKFKYHFTDISNAISILESGTLYSRDKAVELGLMDNDNASKSVIATTNKNHKKYVRFYFRPLTPTQFCNEGIRSVEQRYDDTAHCPIPIFFAFDAVGLLSRDDALFSNGNMASSNVTYGSSKRIFDLIPFGKVFHNSWMPEDQKDSLKFHRHAEVLIRDQIAIDTELSWIGCRSMAETADTFISAIKGHFD